MEKFLHVNKNILKTQQHFYRYQDFLFWDLLIQWAYCYFVLLYHKKKKVEELEEIKKERTKNT